MCNTRHNQTEQDVALTQAMIHTCVSLLTHIYSDSLWPSFGFLVWLGCAVLSLSGCDLMPDTGKEVFTKEATEAGRSNPDSTPAKGQRSNHRPLQWNWSLSASVICCRSKAGRVIVFTGVGVTIGYNNEIQVAYRFYKQLIFLLLDLVTIDLRLRFWILFCYFYSIFLCMHYAIFH